MKFFARLAVRRQPEQDTLVILTSDNGARPGGIDGTFGHDSTGRLRGFKAQLLDGGHRVPFISCWPGKIKPDTENDTLICLTDMMATFAVITGYDISSDMGEDSFNALSVLLGKTDTVRESIIHHDYPGNFAIRKGSWKLVGEQLYNIPQMPLDICVADSQGGIGYMIERQMRNVLNDYNMRKNVV